MTSSTTYTFAFCFGGSGGGGPGTSFGELALMYNSPRAATVRAVTHVKLFALDRITFRQIMADATSKKRRLHEQFLEKVPLFAGMLPTERAKIADVLETVKFAAGETIFQQGEYGDKFYILEEGAVVAKVSAVHSKELKRTSGSLMPSRPSV